MKIRYSIIVLFIAPSLVFARVDAGFIQKNAVELPILLELPVSIAKQLGTYKIITIGEMHGTIATPEFTLGVLRLLATTKRNIVLALEIDQAVQPQIDRFMKSGDETILKRTPFFTRATQDGRSSKAMALLLGETRKIPNVKVICFDPKGKIANGQERDIKMAELLRKTYRRLKPSTMVVLTGNVHAAISVGMPWDAAYKPMGYELYSAPGSPFAQSDILAIRLRFLNGGAWICTQGMPCQITPMNGDQNDYSSAVPFENYFLKEPEMSDGYNATFFSRTISPSLPLVQSAVDCTFSGAQFAEWLAKDYQAFDEDMDHGWRELENKGCYLSAAQVIDTYHLNHLSDLKNRQAQILYFHAGQLYGFEKLYPLAIQQFEKSFNPDESSHSELSWNAYVAATIAFLNKDKTLLLKKREEVAKRQGSAGNKMNLKVIDRLIHCLGQSYGDTYMKVCE